jgi:AAA family ATP:ADP antiporter
MALRERLSDWLDIRASEFRVLVLSVLGAFFIMGFAVMASALRDAFFLGEYDAARLPYILYASLVLGLPAVALFSRLMARRPPHKVMRVAIAATGAGLLLIYALVYLSGPSLGGGPAAVVFYLWTVVSALLLTSGFWIIVSEVFAVREAKRLFGLISAGGAMGTLVIGLSLPRLLSRFEAGHLVPMLVALLALAVVSLETLPRDRLASGRAHAPLEGRGANTLRLLASSRHLWLIAAVVLLTSAVSYIVTWQLQEAIQLVATSEAAQAGLSGDAERMAVNTRIASFMGAFRGWTGGLAFLIQVFLASRILAGAGIGWSLSVLPLALLLGSTGMLLAPGLLMATLVRGADNTLGKSLYRTVAELLWIPVTPATRRRAKAFVDSIVNNAGDGLGALIVLAWVTLGHLPSRFLSAFVMAVALILLGLSRAMGRQYFVTLRNRLQHSGGSAEVIADAGLDRPDRLGATLTRLDVTRVLATSGAYPKPRAEKAQPTGAPEAEPARMDPPAAIRSGDAFLIDRALSEPWTWSEDDVPYLIPLLARDGWLGPAVRALVGIGAAAVPYLGEVLADETADFVIRRRIPRALARIVGAAADQVLVEALDAARFEVRYRVALALYWRRGHGADKAESDWEARVWEAIDSQLGRGKPIWELARLLDAEDDDGFVESRVGLRGELSLEHTFRLLSLVLDRDAVRAAYHGILLGDPELESFALEYLEQVLPEDTRTRLWPFIGDLSATAARRATRKLDDVVADLLQSGATLFGTAEEREALRQYLEESTDES